MSEQIIVFNLGEQLYGIDIKDVAEITHSSTITPLPSQNKNIIEGIVDVRDSIHSVISLRSVLGMDRKEVDEVSKFIILRDEKIALLVDNVKMMVDEENCIKHDIDSIEIFGVKNTMLNYIIEHEDDLITVLDISTFFAVEKEPELV